MIISKKNKSTKNKIIDDEKLEQLIDYTKKLKLNEIKLIEIKLNIFVIKIQKIYRGYIYRLTHLPLILYIYIFQNYLTPLEI
jgi:hypothetical protein